MARPQVLHDIDTNESNIRAIQAKTNITDSNILSLTDSIVSANDSIDDLYSKLNNISNKVDVGNLNPGTEIYIMEAGVLVPYIKIATGYRSNDTIINNNVSLVLRKNIYTLMPITGPSGSIYYLDSTIDTWLNNDFYAILDNSISSVIPTVSVHVPTNVGSTTTSRKIFLLSSYEYNISSPTFYHGVNYSYFDSDNKRIATYNNVATIQHTRDIRNSSTYPAITATGGKGTIGRDINAGIRPAFTLHNTFQVTTAGNPANTLAVATVTP